MKHVVKSDAYLEILLKAPIYVWKYRSLGSGHQTPNERFCPGPILEPGQFGSGPIGTQDPGPRTQDPGPGTRDPGPGDSDPWTQT